MQETKLVELRVSATGDIGKPVAVSFCCRQTVCQDSSVQAPVGKDYAFKAEMESMHSAFIQGIL